MEDVEDGAAARDATSDAYLERAVGRRGVGGEESLALRRVLGRVARELGLEVRRAPRVCDVM